MNDVKIMAHLVAGYPSLEESRQIASALAKGGADYLEIQFPFSDPSADGPVIEHACQASIEAGFRVDDGFSFIRTLTQELAIPVFIMTYGSLVFARGSMEFARRAKESGVRGLIIPDLPPDYAEGLFEAGQSHGLAVVPVIAPEISDDRLSSIAALRPEYVYTALRLGVTGKTSVLDESTMGYLEKVRKTGAKIIAGFGVRSHEQMVALRGYAYAAAVGSYFLETIDNSPKDEIESRLVAAVKRIKGE